MPVRACAPDAHPTRPPEGRADARACARPVGFWCRQRHENPALIPGVADEWVDWADELIAGFLDRAAVERD